MAAGMTRQGRLRPWFGIALLAVCVLLVSSFPVAAQSSRYRVAVLTASSAFNMTIEGLREGLAQLGYHEGKNLSLLIEGAQGPAEIPIQTPEKLFLALNLATARSIGLKLPVSVLERADHLFE